MQKGWRNHSADSKGGAIVRIRRRHTSKPAFTAKSGLFAPGNGGIVTSSGGEFGAKSSHSYRCADACSAEIRVGAAVASVHPGDNGFSDGPERERQQSTDRGWRGHSGLGIQWDSSAIA